MEEQKHGRIGTRIAYIVRLGVPIGLFIFLIRSLNPPAVDPPQKNPPVQQRRTMQMKIEPSPIHVCDDLSYVRVDLPLLEPHWSICQQYTDACFDAEFATSRAFRNALEEVYEKTGERRFTQRELFAMVGDASCDIM